MEYRLELLPESGRLTVCGHIKLKRITPAVIAMFLQWTFSSLTGKVARECQLMTKLDVNKTSFQQSTKPGVFSARAVENKQLLIGILR